MNHPREVLARSLSICVWMVLLMSLFAASATTSFAQSDDGEDDEETALRPGVWALQFQINQNFTLGAFEGSTLSVKKHSSATRAWRFGVSLEADFFDMENEAGDHTEDNDQLIALTGHYLFYPTRKGPVHLYAGPGLRGRYFHDSTRDEQRGPGGDPEVLADVSSEEWSLGLIGTLGVEWFAAKSISLMAEYSTSISYTTRELSGDSRRPSTTLNSWSLRSDAVRFGLSVYL